MWELTINGVDLYHILNWFFIYSFFGWVWETFYVSIKHGEFINRGFVSGPLCTIYGFGAISVYLILKPAEGNLLFLFLGGIVVATLLEYITAVLMESIFHTSWWDYSDNKFNFQGRICLGASLGWGVLRTFVSGAASSCRGSGSPLSGNCGKNRYLCGCSGIPGGFLLFCRCRFPFERTDSLLGRRTGKETGGVYAESKCTSGKPRESSQRCFS